MFSRTMEDSEQAIANESLFESIKGKLGTVVSADKHQLLMAKHYLGGGCARYVFGGSTAQVHKCINAALQKVNSYSCILSTAGHNRLLAKYK
jgi:hypothetical protein